MRVRSRRKEREPNKRKTSNNKEENDKQKHARTQKKGVEEETGNDKITLYAVMSKGAFCIVTRKKKQANNNKEKKNHFVVPVWNANDSDNTNNKREASTK